MFLFFITMVMSILMFIIGNLLSAFIARGFLFIKYDKWQPYGITDFWDDLLSGMVVGVAFGIALTIGRMILNKLR
ncbi:hypothetical protein C7G83_13775 [Siccibacter turicensis]|uniref:Uncharacterized protein n=1 Tax=Siccibacter turicensis TaxID=357233 RepID=A0A2P8VIC3_9ENTR|nr:hypothetical protein C7G83_13775 [Siccibacter turicensis]